MPARGAPVHDRCIPSVTSRQESHAPRAVLAHHVHAPAVVNGPDLLIGFLAGSILAIAITALRVVLVRRFGADAHTNAPVVPPSAEVLDAERRRRPARPLSTRRPR